MEKIALYPGSFDPFTLGHQMIVEQSMQLFDKVIIAIGENSSKKSYFSLEDRKTIIKNCFKDNSSIEVVSYSGLTADYCRQNDIRFIVRGVRNVVDFEFERSIASINKRLNKSLETVFLMTPVEYSDISSTVVREILINGGDPSELLPR